MTLGTLIALVVYAGSSVCSTCHSFVSEGVSYRAQLMDTATLRATRAVITDMAGLEAHPLRQPTTVIESDRRIYILERSVGIHIFDNFRPASPVRTAFLRLPGVESMSVNGSRLYTNSGRDLLAFTVLSPGQITLGQVIEDGYPSLGHPSAGQAQIFEALGDDPARHHIIRWEPVPVP